MVLVCGHCGIYRLHVVFGHFLLKLFWYVLCLFVTINLSAVVIRGHLLGASF